MKLTAFIPHLPAYGCRGRGLPALELKSVVKDFDAKRLKTEDLTDEAKK
jgi:hypothetical protein